MFVLFLYAFPPSFIGHTVFVTMDVALACFVIMSFYFGISYCKKRGKKDIILFFLSQSLAIVTKFSAILFLPFFVALLFCSSLSKKEFAKNFLILLGVIFTVVSISYGSIFGINNYFEGLFRVNSDHLRLDTYFAGNFYKERVYLYFIYCYLLKTPIVAILIFLAAIFFILKKYQFRNFELNLLFISPFCFLVIHSLYAAPLGIRYILPTLAITLVLSGIVANHINSKHLLVLAIILLVEVLPTYPNFLGYFNFSIGGNNNGYLYLDDSNLDWGQNLNKLANFQREVLKNQELTVVGSSPVPLQFYNIKVKDAIYLISDFRDTLNKGYFAISPHFLIRASNPNFQNSINWLDKDPIARIGSSFLIYKVD